MKDIYVYVEGGGGSQEQKAELRRGFDAPFEAEKTLARTGKIGLVFVCCGGRQQAYEAFRNGIDVRPERVNALLVDSETSLPSIPQDKAEDAGARRKHLSQRDGAEGRGQGDGWKFDGVDPRRIHLMVQCMEAWIVADPEALESFYKQGFKQNSLPKRQNLEEEPKDDIYAKLEKAREETKKGKYAKIKHASHLLLKIEREKVANRCPRFSIFRDWLSNQIGASAE